MDKRTATPEAKKRARVDVVLPNYNKAAFIEECLQSLKAQTFSRWRCIVVDGYSDDGSWEAIQRAAEGDDRFDLYQLERIGLYESWNWGLSKVTSPYFAILTSDDVWHQEWLEAAVKGLDHNESALCAAARTWVIDEGSNVQEVATLNELSERLFARISSGERHVRSGPVSSTAVYFMGSIYTSMHALVMRSEVLDHMRFSTDVGTIADREWYMKMGLLGDILYIGDMAAYWRSYPQQRTKSSYAKRKTLGEQAGKINERNKKRIAERLGARRDIFLREAQRYNSRYVPYFYERPSLRDLRSAPLTGLGKLLTLLVQYPGLLLSEVLTFALHRKKFINEQRLKMVYRVVKNAS